METETLIIEQNQEIYFERVMKLVWRISLNCFGNPIRINVSPDKKFENGRLFIQLQFSAPCSKSGEWKEWKGRKWYLSKFMTDDEIIKTVFSAFKAVIEHEILEGFKIDDKRPFNPHISIEDLLAISNNEIARPQIKQHNRTTVKELLNQNETMTQRLRNIFKWQFKETDIIEEITKEEFMKKRTAGIRTWGEFENLRKENN